MITNCILYAYYLLSIGMIVFWILFALLLLVIVIVSILDSIIDKIRFKKGN